jgi:hypothetical protein
MSDQLPPLVAPADDPRAAAGIARAKALCGLAGFVVAGLGAYGAGDLFATVERALAGGVTGYLLGWAVGLAAWRRIMRAETRRAIELLQAKRDSA